ncbi:ABC transporter permease [Dyella mobilis]|uniref:ABC transporter permease n=1 Tax=Dyella mobilis TaxID=1849582 RepID=A0ABS2KBX2_9GAMM|nr:ABC transporter permease [Dyella mobilis]MBM7128594.1 ABC transporter permease [Dyella mobilis]GLQ99502.1 Na+ ABC transporter permease [Dyella mobilis]
MKTTLTVFLKEVRENLRDKRTVMSALLYGPLLGPVIFVMIMHTVLTRELDKADQPIKVPVIGAQYAPNLIDALRQQGFVPQPPVADPEAAVRNQDADIVLRIPEDFGKAWRQGETSQVELIYDSSQRDTDGSVDRVKRMLDAYVRHQGAMRLVARGLSPAMMVPVSIDERDQATPQSRAGQLFAMMPYFFVLTIFMGGMYLAIDLTAGERERQSLEPLFANPVPRWKVFLGKLSAICVFSLVSLVISVIGFGICGRFIPAERMGMVLDLGPSFAVRVLLMMLPLIILLASLQTLVAAFAKSYREAQTYLSVLMLVPALPSILLSAMPIKVANWMYAVPLLGQQVGITQLLRGGELGMQQIAMCFASGLVLAIVVALITAHVYRSERLAISV